MKKQNFASFTISCTPLVDNRPKMYKKVSLIQISSLPPAKSVSSAAEGVKGLFLGNIIFLRQILHTDLQLLFFCPALPLRRKLPETN